MSNPPPPYLRLQNGMYITQTANGNCGIFDKDGSLIVAIGPLVGGNEGAIALSKTVITQYNGLSTKGLGVSAIYAAGVQTLNTNVAPTLLTYTPPATAGVYRFTGYLNLLTAGTMTFRVKITYKDPGGNAVTDIPGFYLQNSTAIVAGGNTANTAGRYKMLSDPIAIDNSATAITIQDNAGTYTAGTYYWTPILEQLA